MSERSTSELRPAPGTSSGNGTSCGRAHYGVCRQTTSALWERYNTAHSVNNRSRSGRHRVTTAAQDRYIRVRRLRNRTTTATITATQIPGQRRTSDQTVHHRLNEARIFRRRPGGFPEILFPACTE